MSPPVARKALTPKSAHRKVKMRMMMKKELQYNWDSDETRLPTRLPTTFWTTTVQATTEPFSHFFFSIKLRQSTHVILAPNQPPTSDRCVYKYDFECCELSLTTKGEVSRFITLKFSGTRDELTLACFGCSLVQI